MDNQKIVFSEHQHEHDRAALPHVAILVFQSAGLALVLFLVAGLWYLLGFKPAFIAILVCCVIGAGAWVWRAAHHHVHDIADRKVMRELASRAIENGHSVEYKPTTRELRTISPFTIPGSPITIKDNQFGSEALPQLAPVLPTAPPFSRLISQISAGHLFLGQGVGAAI